jgi:hypothetical protein
MKWWRVTVKFTLCLTKHTPWRCILFLTKHHAMKTSSRVEV